MIGHLLPLGPSQWRLNGAVAACGMAIFFTLSGFLITSILLRGTTVRTFLIRRLFRIVPLAWAAMLVLIFVNHASFEVSAANLTFVANLPPVRLLFGGEHLWSLCVEVQFYAAIALLVALAGRKALFALPVLGICVTIIRVFNAAQFSIYTYERLDEILAGCSLALFYRYAPGLRTPRLLAVALAPLALASSHQSLGFLCYLRPYLVAAMVGSSLFGFPAPLLKVFASRISRWIAEISYGLYVFHGMLASTWLGSGVVLVKYAKRPLLVLLTFALAQGSYRYFEAPLQRVGKRVEQRLS